MVIELNVPYAIPVEESICAEIISLRTFDRTDKSRTLHKRRR